MKQLPIQEMPYEKCWRSGAESLTDAELLSVILRTGSRGEPAIELSRKVLALSKEQGLLGIYHTSLAELMKIRGIGQVKAIQLKCIAELSKRIAKKQVSGNLIFSEPETIAEYYMEDFRHEEQEKLLVIFLNSKNHFLGEEIISKGTVNATMISPREIFLCALKYHAVSIILLHNHPSGHPTPSREDLLLTRRVKECGEMIGIELLDHIIIGDQTAVSFKMEKLL
ncbi:MAG: DNA repair protein RadC [Lachnospiraceae bacterium]|nr:DNA repair protein RadC [Lachnospiraceae bacterium]